MQGMVVKGIKKGLGQIKLDDQKDVRQKLCDALNIKDNSFHCYEKPITKIKGKKIDKINAIFLSYGVKEWWCEECK